MHMLVRIYARTSNYRNMTSWEFYTCLSTFTDLLNEDQLHTGSCLSSLYKSASFISERKLLPLTGLSNVHDDDNILPLPLKLLECATVNYRTHTVCVTRISLPLFAWETEQRRWSWMEFSLLNKSCWNPIHVYMFEFFFNKSNWN